MTSSVASRANPVFILFCRSTVRKASISTATKQKAKKVVNCSQQQQQHNFRIQHTYVCQDGSCALGTYFKNYNKSTMRNRQQYSSIHSSAVSNLSFHSNSFSVSCKLQTKFSLLEERPFYYYFFFPCSHHDENLALQNLSFMRVN